MQKSQQPLTDSQWEYIKPYIDNGRKRKTCLRMVVNAILWITRTGAQWRNIDSEYKPSLPIILYYFYRWQKNQVLDKLMDALNAHSRTAEGCCQTPSLVALDSQSVKLSPMMDKSRGIDGNKKINGRKRHIVVDKFGLLYAVIVTGANVNDAKAGLELLPVLEKYNTLQLIALDKAYAGEFLDYIKIYGWEGEIAQKPESCKGFIPQKGRWQVERSFAWLNFYRRLSKDFERTAQSAATFIKFAFINMNLAKYGLTKT
jgi:transposase